MALSGLSALATNIGDATTQGWKVGVPGAALWVWTSIKDLGVAFQTLFLSMPLIWASFWAIVMIVAFALIGLGIMYMIYVLNPRIPGLNHIFDIEAYVKDTYNPNLIRAIQTIASYRTADETWVSSLGGIKTLIASAKTLVEQGEALDGELKVYLAFRSSIQNNDNFVTAADIRTNAPQFVKSDGTTIDTSEFVYKVATPLNDLWSSSGTVSGQLQDLGDLRTHLESVGIVPKSEKERLAVLFATAVHQVRMMMDQIPAVEAIHMADRPSKNAIWTLYYLPFMRNVFTVRIPSTWMNWDDDFVRNMNFLHGLWASMGDYVTTFPLMIANQMRPSMEGFRVQVREGFGLGDLFSLVGAIGNLMGNIGTIVNTFAGIIMSFVRNPFMALIQFLVLTLSVMITIPLVILYFICDVLMLGWAFSAVYGAILATWWCVAYTLFLIITVILVAIPYFFLWLLDIMTGGMVSRLMRCENSPNGWYADPGFVEHNEYSSAPMSCWGPCAQRYKQTYGGTCCGARSGFMPDFCPQQQIYRIYEKGAIPSSDPGPVAFVNYTPQPGFNAMTMLQKKGSIETAYMEKIGWYQTCYDGMNKQDYLTRHICDNVDVLFPYEHPSPPPQVNVTLSTVCKEIFCDYKPGTSHAWRTDSGYQSSANKVSCARLVEAASKNIAAPASPPGTDLFRQVLLVTLAVVAIMISVRSIRDAEIQLKTNS